jgi:hypothetical protein
VGITKSDPFCEVGVGSERCTHLRWLQYKGNATHLLFRSQPFATKLANTLSACVLDIGEVSAFTSRSAAREEMEYELFGASMICSTWSGVIGTPKYTKSHGWQSTYQCSEVGYLERRIVARDTSNFVIPTIDLGLCAMFINGITCGFRGTSYQSVHILSSHFIAYSGEFQVEGIE